MTTTKKKTKKTWTKPSQPLYDKEIHTVLNMIRRKNLSDKEVCEQAGITVQTLRNWRLGYENGGTRYPANWRLMAVATACGFERVWQEIKVRKDKKNDKKRSKDNLSGFTSSLGTIT